MDWEYSQYQWSDFRSGYNFYMLWEIYYNEYLWLQENGNFYDGHQD